MKTIQLAILLILSSISVLGAKEYGFSEEKTMPGAMYAKNEKENFRLFLPLKKTDVKLWVSAGIVHAEVSQVFKNDSQYPLEAIYVFPLPSRSTVTDMVLETNDRIIRSVVKERAEAKQIYEAAKKAGKKTALIEEERPNIFTTSVANFLPGETVKIKISYIEPIEYKKGSYEVNFPMVVGPRYIPFKLDVDDNGVVDAQPAVADAPRITPPLLHPTIDSGHRLTMNVIIEGIPLGEIISNTHAIKVDKETDNRFAVSLKKPETIPDRDFNLKLLLHKTGQPELTSLNSVNGEKIYSMINIFPPVEDEKLSKANVSEMPREVIFLIDTSGSMSGSSISQAKSGLKYCLKMLHPEDFFTIVRFANDYSSFSPDLRKVTPDSLAAAEGYINGLSSNGGTEMQKALQYVLEMSPQNNRNIQMIVFLTDGDVGNEDSLLRLLANKLGRRRLFTFGIGSAPNEFLMRKMAEEGRGQCRFIHSHEDISVIMSDFFKTLASPVLTDISLTWLDEHGEKAAGVTVFPDPPPDVFIERPLTLLVSYTSGKVDKLLLKGTISGKEKLFEYPIKQVKGVSYPSIEKLYAQSEINQLMFKIIMDPASEKSGRKDILDIALTHQLVTKYTSRVAVEQKIERKPDGTLVSVNVPVELPNGWDSSSFFPTATNDPLLLLIGGITMLLGLSGLLTQLRRRKLSE